MTNLTLKRELRNLLEEMRCFKFQTNLIIDFEKQLKNDETDHVTNYFSSNTELIAVDLNINEVLSNNYFEGSKMVGGRICMVN